MKALLSWILAALVAAPVSSFGQSLKDAKVAYRSGNWKVLRSIDPMRDTTSCTGIYKENYSIQLAPDTLFIGVQGGIESVTLRFGERPATRLRLATDMEKRIRSVMINGAEFNELSGSGRLRYQVGTLVSGTKTDDIDMTGFDEALANIRSGCAGDVEATSNAPTTSAAGTLCSAALVTRMRNEGIPAGKIEAICR